MGRQATITDRKYEASDVWRCPDAPIQPHIELQVKNGTGAHYWVQDSLTEKMIGNDYFQCRYCGDVRKYPGKWNSIIMGDKNNWLNHSKEE